MPALTLPAFDYCIDAIGLGAPRPFEDSPDINTTDFGDVSPRVTFYAKHERLPTNLFEGFGRELLALISLFISISILMSFKY